jgi:hypothetical protein
MAIALDRRQRRRIVPKFIALPVESLGLCVKVFPAFVHMPLRHLCRRFGEALRRVGIAQPSAFNAVIFTSRPAATPPGADTVWSAPPRPATKTKAKIEPHSAVREGNQYRDMKTYFLDGSGGGPIVIGPVLSRPTATPPGAETVCPQNPAALAGP